MDNPGPWHRLKAAEKWPDFGPVLPIHALPCIDDLPVSWLRLFEELLKITAAATPLPPPQWRLRVPCLAAIELPPPRLAAPAITRAQCRASSRIWSHLAGTGSANPLTFPHFSAPARFPRVAKPPPHAGILAAFSLVSLASNRKFVVGLNRIPSPPVWSSKAPITQSRGGMMDHQKYPPPPGGKPSVPSHTFGRNHSSISWIG